MWGTQQIIILEYRIIVFKMTAQVKCQKLKTAPLKH